MALMTRQEHMAAEAAKEAAFEKQLEEFADGAYRHLSRQLEIRRPYVYFSGQGSTRLTHIYGYILALLHAGTEEGKKLGRKMFSNLHWAMDCANSKREIEYSFEGETIKKIPAQKVILYDDGSLHSFAVLWLRPVDPNRFHELLQQNQATLDAQAIARPAEAKYQPSAADLTRTAVKARLHVEGPDTPLITESRFVGGRYVDVYYQCSHNGGLIYHGPGNSENFTISLDTSGHYWGLHT